MGEGPVNFADLTWLLIGAGVFATGLGFVLAAWHAPAIVAAIRDHAESNRQLGDALNSNAQATRVSGGRKW